MPPSDAEKVVKEFFAYAIEKRREGVGDFAAIVEGFKKALLADDDRDGAFSKKMLRMMREFLAADPKYQKILASAPVVPSGRALGRVRKKGLLADESQEHCK